MVTNYGKCKKLIAKIHSILEKNFYKDITEHEDDCSCSIVFAVDKKGEEIGMVKVFYDDLTVYWQLSYYDTYYRNVNGDAKTLKNMLTELLPKGILYHRKKMVQKELDAIDKDFRN